MDDVIRRYHNLLEKLLPGEATFAPFEIPGHWANTQQRLDGVGQVFMQGCHEALEADTEDTLLCRLHEVEEELRGFAFEGAGMGLGIFDYLTQWHMERLQGFATGLGATHSHLLYIGAGWACARLRKPIEPLLARLDPLFGWLAVDGYGFHEGYLVPRYRCEQALPERLAGYALQVFDQGLGRCCWFVYNANIDHILTTISAFAPSRQQDLWSGIGLACAYTGVVERAVLEELRRRVGAYASSIAQGVAIATKIRHLGENVAPHTELACQVFCSMSADKVAAITNLAGENLSSTQENPAYALWQQRIRLHFV